MTIILISHWYLVYPW